MEHLLGLYGVNFEIMISFVLRAGSGFGYPSVCPRRYNEELYHYPTLKARTCRGYVLIKVTCVNYAVFERPSAGPLTRLPWVADHRSRMHANGAKALSCQHQACQLRKEFVRPNCGGQNPAWLSHQKGNNLMAVSEVIVTFGGTHTRAAYVVGA
jgi:hypothetical protein